MGIECEQCGLIHPPIPKGQVCPVAAAKEEERQLKEANNIKLTNNFSTIKSLYFNKLKEASDEEIEELSMNIIKVLEEFQKK